MVLSTDSLFSRFINGNFEPWAVFDSEFRIALANPPFAAQYGLTVQDMIGKPCFEVLHHRSSKCEICCLDDVFGAGEPKSWEEARATNEGKRYFEVQCYPVKDLEGITAHVVRYSHDITHRKHAEEETTVSEERCRAIVQIAREGIFVLDAKAVIIYANDRFIEMLGYSAGEVVGRSLFELMDKDGLVEAKIERNPEGLVDIREMSFRCKDGNPLVTRMSMSSLMHNKAFAGSVGIVGDIAEVNGAEVELRSAKELSEKIINSITDNLVVIDPKTFQIVQANDHFLARVGREASAVLNRTCYEVMLGRTRPCEAYGILCPVRETARLKRSATAERVYGDVGENQRTLEVIAYPLLDDQGEVSLVIRLERDVTEKRSMENALTLRAQELQLAKRQLEALFEISREVTSMGSLAELINFIIQTTMEIFPASEPVFFVLSGEDDSILHLRDCQAALAKPMWRLIAELEQSGLVGDFVGHLKNLKPHSVQINGGGDVPPELGRFSIYYSSWFGLPVFAQENCIGYFLVGSNTGREFSPDELHFLHALLAQVGGHIRHLILHEAEILNLRQSIARRTSFGEIVGQSKRMREIFELTELVAASDVTVLITGANGTGKEVVARAIHKTSHRCDGPFVVANCSAYSPTLLESELFGHEKGSFTGAIKRKLGRIERAQGGTLFLDEIGDIAPPIQLLLLRFLEDHRFERVGGEEMVKADVRVLAATNRDLRQEVEAGRFREDLYYRLNVISIHLPPLRERKEDIPLLCDHFLHKFNLTEGREIRAFSSEAMQALMEYDWPGNVRQLANAISHAFILCPEEIIERSHLPRSLSEAVGEVTQTSLAENERRVLLKVLRETNWNKCEAARRLKLSRSTLYSKIQRYKLSKERQSIK
jgi:PAS domain S-box-containing protein